MQSGSVALSGFVPIPVDGELNTNQFAGMKRGRSIYGISRTWKIHWWVTYKGNENSTLPKRPRLPCAAYDPNNYTVPSGVLCSSVSRMRVIFNSEWKYPRLLESNVIASPGRWKNAGPDGFLQISLSAPTVSLPFNFHGLWSAALKITLINSFFSRKSEILGETVFLFENKV